MSAGTQLIRNPAPAAARSIERAVRYLLSLQRPEGYWWAELTADSTLESDYILLQMWLYPPEGRVWNPPNRDQVDRAARAGSPGVVAVRAGLGGVQAVPFRPCAGRRPTRPAQSRPSNRIDAGRLASPSAGVDRATAAPVPRGGRTPTSGASGLDHARAICLPARPASEVAAQHSSLPDPLWTGW